MATPEFRAVLRIYRLPDGEHFGASLPAAARGVWKHNGAAYLYNGDKTLGYYFDESQLELIDEITEPDGLTAEWTATDICSWSVSQIYPPNSDIAAWLLGNVRPSLALRPRNFVVLKIISSDDDDTSDDIADPLLGDVIASAPVDVSDGAVLTPGAVGRLPDWVKRGMSGVAMDVDWSPVQGGIRIHLRGVSWLWWTQATAHLREAASQTGTWEELLAGTLTANASYTIMDFAETLFGGPDAEGSQEYKISLDESALPDEAIVSPVGLHSLVITDETTGDTTTPSLLGRGSHNMLQTLQRATESREKWLDGSTNIFRIRDFGGTEEQPKLVWDAADFFGEPKLSDRIPRATAFSASHPDYRRNWQVYSAVPHLAAIYGHIQKSIVSIAPKPQSFADEPTWTAAAARAAILRTSDELILNHIKAQAKAEALAEADNLYGSGMLRWHDGTKFAIDFFVGDIIEVRFGDHDAFSSVRGSRRGLVVRKVALALDGNRRWGINVGFGALADIAPAFNPDRVDMPRAIKDKPPITDDAPVHDYTPPFTNWQPPAPPTDDDDDDEPPAADSPEFVPAPFDPGSETPPGAGEPPPPAPFDPGSETLPGQGEPPAKASDRQFRPAPYDPGAETIPGASEAAGYQDMIRQRDADRFAGRYTPSPRQQAEEEAAKKADPGGPRPTRETHDRARTEARERREERLRRLTEAMNAARRLGLR